MVFVVFHVFFQMLKIGQIITSSFRGKPDRNLVATMDIKVLGSIVVAQLVCTSSPWSPIFNPQSGLCGTFVRQSGTEILVQIMLFVSLDRLSCFKFSLFLNQFSYIILTNNEDLSVLSVHSETSLIHF
jgi:hypothetical protein